MHPRWRNPSSNYTGSETAANLNSSNAKSVTVKAKWTLVSYTKTFSYTGSAQTWTVPYTGRYKIELWGAQGGADCQTSVTDRGGYGAYTSGTISLSKNASLYAYVGGAAADGRAPTSTCPTAYFNITRFNNGLSSKNGWSSGGATDIRSVSGNWDNASSLRSRIMVAASGGVTSANRTAPSAGGLIGYDGDYSKGGTQTSVGTLASGATTYEQSYFGIANGGCTGGNGWYPAPGATCAQGSGGGSSYISGHTGSVAVASTSNSSPKSGCSTGTATNSCSISPYGYTFTNTLMIDGKGYKWTNTKGALQAMPNPSGGNYASGVGHSGNGYARITYLGA